MSTDRLPDNGGTDGYPEKEKAEPESGQNGPAASAIKGPTDRPASPSQETLFLLRFVAISVAAVCFMALSFWVLEREFLRVAPEEKDVAAWIAGEGGQIKKEGPKRHITSVSLANKPLKDTDME